MKRALVLIACAASGCRSLLGIDDPTIGDATGAIDAPASDGNTDGPCAIPRISLPLIGDAVMISATPTQGHGLDPVMNIGIGEGILKFDVSNLPPMTRRLVLQLPHVVTADECGAGCAACAVLEKSGELHAAFLRSDWTEATANYNQRSSGLPWQINGAQGVTDRSAVAGAVLVSGTSTVSLEMATTELAAWIDPANQRLSVVVSPVSDAAIIIRQHQAWAENCAPVPDAPVLLADSCP